MTDSDWRLGLAKLRATQIINLIGLCHGLENVPVTAVVLRSIRAEAQAILNDWEAPAEYPE